MRLGPLGLEMAALDSRGHRGPKDHLNHTPQALERQGLNHFNRNRGQNYGVSRPGLRHTPDPIPQMPGAQLPPHRPQAG